MTDKKIKWLLLLYLAVSLIVFAGTVLNYLPAAVLPLLNIISGIAIIAPWLKKYAGFPHRVEKGELVFLGAELLAVIVSIGCLIFRQPPHWFLISQYGIAGLHMLAATLFLVFMLVFKMKKLF